MVWSRNPLYQSLKRMARHSEKQQQPPPPAQGRACPSCRAHGCCAACGPKCRCTRIIIRPPLFSYYTDVMH